MARMGRDERLAQAEACLASGMTVRDWCEANGVPATTIYPWVRRLCEERELAATYGNCTFVPTDIEGIVVIEMRSLGDARGYFMERYKRGDFEAGGIACEFVQDNQSSSVRGTLRGLHYQIEHPQAKLVRVVAGEVFDVAVDLREGSPTFGKWEGIVLSAENCRQLFIPRGFAHGFLALTDCTFCYKCDDTYHLGDERGIMWDDSTISIEWPSLAGDVVFDPARLILSDKDRCHPCLH